MPDSAPSLMATARQPKWIAMLLLALVIATVFVALSAWQFDASRSEHTYDHDTEEAVELTEIYEPVRPIGLDVADRIVNLRGEFLEDTQVMIADRLQDGEDGYWAVAAFRVEGSPDDQVIPVVRGWSEDYDDAGSPPEGQLELQGRLLPTEAPGPGPRDLPVGVLPTLSVAELINLWGEDSYSGFVFDLSVEAIGESTTLESVWVGPQPEESEINWQNLFYAIEWIVFAGFAFYMWWRLVKDDHIRQQEEARLDREWEEQWRAEQLAKLQAARATDTETKDQA